MTPNQSIFLSQLRCILSREAEKYELNSHSQLIIGFATRVTRWVPLVEQELLTITGHMRLSRFFVWLALLNLSFLCSVLETIICHFVIFHLNTVLFFFFVLRLLITPLVYSIFFHIKYFILNFFSKLTTHFLHLSVNCERDSDNIKLLEMLFVPISMFHSLL